jgi:protein-arginine kinase activator protein McsA
MDGGKKDWPLTSNLNPLTLFWEELRMEKKEKPLEKMTVKELREMAFGMPGVHGVHAMKKEELIAAIRAAKGITEPEPKKEKHVVTQKEKIVLTIAEMKQKMKALRAKKEGLLQQKNWRMAGIVRKQISRLKKKTRRAA